MSALSDASWDYLPKYVRDADDGTLRALFDSLAAPVEANVKTLAEADYTADEYVTPFKRIAWLAAMAGIDVSTVPNDRKRAIVGDASWRYRGSLDALKKRVGETLTGAKSVEIVTPYGMTGAGNLLTSNQATGTDTSAATTGFTPSGTTLASDTGWSAQGSRSLKVTISGASYPRVAADPYPAVIPGDVVTFYGEANTGTLSGANLSNFVMSTDFLDSGLAQIGSTMTTALSGGVFRATMTAPTGAAYARLRFVINSGSATIGEFFRVDKLGVWLAGGAGAVWDLPGVPNIPDPDAIAVTTFASQTPDPTATEAAIRAEIPAWMAPTIVTDAAGQSYANLAADYADYGTMTATGKSYGTLSQEV